MPRTASDPIIAFGPRPAGATLTAWLYGELRGAILAGRLRRGARLPATRDLAASQGLSRRIVVNVFEQLRDEGYLTSRVGVGTIVSQQVPEDFAVTSTRRTGRAAAVTTAPAARTFASPDPRSPSPSRSLEGRAAPSDDQQVQGKPQVGETSSEVSGFTVVTSAASVLAGSTRSARVDRLPEQYRRPARAFRPIEVALDELPIAAWTRAASQAQRRLTPRLLGGGDLAGLAELREAVAGYLGSSRGVACTADQIVILSGAQQALDLLARLLIEPGDAVWIEDPGYSGAVDAFRNARARLVPVRVDVEGLDPAAGRRLCPRPRAVYVTPAHQFPLGATLSLQRRFDLLRWARDTGVVLIEDDYDSEFRFTGRPVPAMKGLDGADSVFLIGSCNKMLFPALRLGYVVVPDAWIDRLLALRHQSDRYPASLPQATLTRFIDEGHFGRHLRRLREIYGRRRLALAEAVARELKGLLALPDIPAGLSTPAWLLNGMSSRQAAALAAREQVDAWPLDRFALKRRDLRGLLLGFAAFSEREIQAGVETLAKALS